MGKRLTQEEVIKRFRVIHGDKYDYSKVEYVNKRTKVTIICPEHGEFDILPENHYGKIPQGCWPCGIKSSAKTRTNSTENFIKKSIEKHGDLYNYSKVVYKYAQEKVTIVCKIHGEFEQKACDHTQGRGCWQCRHSRGEATIAKILSKHGIGYEQEHSFNDLKSERGRPLRFDFRLDNGVLIEYDGQQHFEESTGYYKGKLEKIQSRDKQKTEYCEINGLTLLRIPYTMDSIEIEKQIMKLINYEN